MQKNVKLCLTRGQESYITISIGKDDNLKKFVSDSEKVV